MESDDSIIEIIKIKVRNTLNLDKIDRNVLGYVEDHSFRGHYYSPYELTEDVRLVENLNKRETLIEWLKRQKTRDPIIRQALECFEEEK
jgi:hypothetical protein